MWLYRYFKRNVAATQVTLDAGVTGGLVTPNIQTGTVSTVTQTTASTYINLMNGVYMYKWAGMTTLTVPIPHAIGDIGVDTTNGKLYVAGAAAASTDWKLVTSA
jgi:hypothetical protein